MTGGVLLQAITARLIDLEQLVRNTDPETVDLIVRQHLERAISHLNDASLIHQESVHRNRREEVTG